MIEMRGGLKRRIRVRSSACPGLQNVFLLQLTRQSPQVGHWATRLLDLDDGDVSGLPAEDLPDLIEHLMAATDLAVIGACQKIVERCDCAGILDHFVPTASPDKNTWILRLSTGIPSYSTASLLVRFAESAKSQAVQESWLGVAVSVVEHMNLSLIFQIAAEAALSDGVHSALSEIIAKLVEPGRAGCVLPGSRLRE
jgi:hypothetical protein